MTPTAQSWRGVFICVLVVAVWLPVQFWVMDQVVKWWRGEK